LKFLVQGPQAAEIRQLFARWDGGYQLQGWTAQPDYAGLDVLIHPATAEPYGMVIAEAMAARVPVVVSDACGAAPQVTADAGAVLGLHETVDAWADAVERQLRRGTSGSTWVRGWLQVAQEYEGLYTAILAGVEPRLTPERLAAG
jgi:UDP-glucose:(heptosyl)LPS alpha-1,3-glucosyltransferase